MSPAQHSAVSAAGAPALNLDLGGLAGLGLISLLVVGAWAALLAPTRRPTSEVALAAFLCSLAHILAAEVALGLAGALTTPALAAVMALTWLGLAFAARRRWRADAWAARMAAARGAWADLRASPATLALLALLGAWSAWTIFLGLIFPPYAYDEFLYHMPIAASVIQSGSVLSIPSPSPWISAYPRFAELLAVWVSIFFGRDTFADLALLPQLWGLGLGLYVAARRLGASRAWSVACASMGWFAPVILIQAKGSYNDIMIGCLWAIGLAFALPPRHPSPSARAERDAWWVGLCAGLLIGTKITGLALAAGLAAIFAGRLILARAGWRRAVHGLARLAAVALIAGGVWGLINFTTFGNPIYPAPVNLGGRELLPGRADLAALFYADEASKVAHVAPGIARLVYAWLERQDGVAIDARLAGLGPLWATLGLPAVAIWLALGLARRDAVPGLVAGAHLALLLVLPAAWVPRFSVFLLALGGCALAGAAPAFGRAARGWTWIASVGLAAFSLFASVDHRYFDVARIREFAALAEHERSALRWDPRSFGPAYQWVERHAADGATVAYGDGVILPYPLWGPRFERRVIYVPVARPEDYPGALRAAGARYAVLGSSEAKAAALRADPRARVAFDGGDGLTVFEVGQP